MEKKGKKKRREKEDFTSKEEKNDILKIKENKEEIIRHSENEEIKELNEGQVKSENKVLRNFFIWLGVFAISFILVFLLINSINHFEYKGINFNVVKDTGGIIFYHLEEGYNLRKDPRKLEYIPFEGEINFTPRPKLVYNSTGGFNCDGDGIIAVGNFALILHNLAGIDVVKDQNATCDSQGRYMFVNVQPGNETGIKQTGPACYDFNVNNCEILEVTEKFIVETLARVKKIKEI